MNNNDDNNDNNNYAWLAAATDLDLDPSEAAGMLPVCGLDCSDGALFFRTLAAWLVKFENVPRAAFYPAWFALTPAARAELVQQHGAFTEELGPDAWITSLARRDDALMLRAALNAGVLVAPSAAGDNNNDHTTTATVLLAVFEHGAAECMAELMRDVAPGDWTMAFALALCALGMRLRTFEERETEMRELTRLDDELFELMDCAMPDEFTALDWACRFAAARGHLSLLQLLREQGRCESSYYCLVVAAAYGRADCFRYLLESSSIMSSHEQNNLLFCAAAGGNVECLELLRDQQSPVMYFHEKLEKAIAITAARGHLAAMQFLIAVVIAEYFPNGQYTVLVDDHFAVQNAALNGRIDCLRYLLRSDPRGQFADYHTLGAAAVNGHLDCLRLLRGEEQVGDRVVSWGTTSAVQCAVSHGHLDCLQYLLDAGCPRYVDGEENVSRLFRKALGSGCVRTLEYVCSPAMLGIADDTQPLRPRNMCVYCYAGSVDCLRYVHEHRLGQRARWCGRCIENAADDPPRLRYLLEVMGVPAREPNAYFFASTHIESLRLLHETARLQWRYQAPGKQSVQWRYQICSNLASSGTSDENPECLVYMHEQVMKCAWDKEIYGDIMFSSKSFAAMQAALDHGCPLTVTATAAAARTGNLAALRWLRDRGCPWSETTTAAAAQRGQLHCLRYAHEHGCPLNVASCMEAARVASRRTGAAACLTYLQSIDDKKTTASGGGLRRSKRIAAAATATGAGAAMKRRRRRGEDL